MMRAYHLDKPKHPLDLRPHSVREATASEVGIDALATSIHPVDLETRSGRNAMLLPHRRPFVPGVDFVGRVADGARMASGTRVFGYLGIAGMGAFAERVFAPASAVAEVPSSFSDEEAAVFPLPALCAMQAIDATPGEGPHRVLVHGGAGGVGSVAVQVLSGLGHDVLATASESDTDWVRELGASKVIDYRQHRFEEHVKDMDLVLDTVGGDITRRSFEVVREGGAVVTLNGMPTAAVLREAGLRVPAPMAWLLPLMGWSLRRRSRAARASFSPQVTVPHGERLSRAATAVSTRGFRARIAKRLPFASLNEAMDLVEAGGLKGRVVVTVP